jgi:hypothetical protein
MKKSCAYIVRNGMFPYGITGDATEIEENLYLFEPHGNDYKVVLHGEALCFRPSPPKWASKN